MCCVFGWVRKSNGLRRFRLAYIEVPRKNAKSTLSAGVGLYMLLEDGEPGAEVYAGATSEKQAHEVFSPAVNMAKRADDLAEEYGISIPKSRQPTNLAILETNSKFETLIGDPGDGGSPHLAIVDEYHEHKTANLYDTMETGMGAREQPLMWVTTTAGSNLAGPCYLQRQQVIKVLNGTLDNDEIFGIIYTLDDRDDWTDLSAWKKANPNYGVSVNADYLKSRLKIALQNPSKQNAIRCKHLNQWMNARTAWIDMQKWKRCGIPP